MGALSGATKLFVASLAVSLAYASSGLAEVQVVVDENQGMSATRLYRFPRVPSPVANDAGNLAKIRLVEGRRYGNGSTVRCLIDGKLPTGQDDPSSNFHFYDTERGLLIFDLGKAVDIRQINTYSWHPRGRGPQVYSLYGAGEDATNLDLSPRQIKDLERAGWTRLAEVDTRDGAFPKKSFPLIGGQYGVSIDDSEGQKLGTFRYLLFEILPTDPNRPGSHTFFSEIDFLDGTDHPLPPPDKHFDTLDVDGKYTITFDTTDVPELRGFVDAKLKPVCTEWYPKIVALLPSEQFTPPDQFTIVFHSDMDGVAHASGTTVHCAGTWFLRNVNGEAPGAIVHEMVHIVQQYRPRRGGNRNPGWMVEGVADYIRWFLYEPGELRPQPNPERSNFDDSYLTSAAFLNYVVSKYDADLVKKFNAAMREGAYADDLWVEFTGKTAPQLWEEYVGTL